MTHHEIQTLLGRFMDGLTTLDEERRLADYFRTADVPDEWQAYKAMFAYLDAGMPQDGEKPARTRRLWWLAAAAAVAVLLGVAVLATRGEAEREVAVSAGTSADKTGGVGENAKKTASFHHLADNAPGVADSVLHHETPRDTATQAMPRPKTVRRQSLKYRYEPAPPRAFLAEAAAAALTDSISTAAQQLAEAKVQEVEQQQRLYMQALQLAGALQTLEMASLEAEDEGECY